MVVQRKSLIGRPKERKKVYKVGSYIPFVGLRFLIHCNFISTEESKNEIKAKGLESKGLQESHSKRFL